MKSTKHIDSFKSKQILKINNKPYTIFSVKNIDGVEKMPFSIKILLENLLRFEDGKNITKAQIENLISRDLESEILYNPSRVLMQDFTGVPAIVDLAAMRDEVAKKGKNPELINPMKPTEMVIDHSVQVDSFGSDESLQKNISKEFERNNERYKFLKWGQNAFKNLTIVPPGVGIVHQINLEKLARVVFADKIGDEVVAYPDTVVGTDSHTTMINALGTLGWGVGGIEAESVMLNQPISMLIPKVVGVRLYGSLPVGTTITDLVLTIVEMLRKHGVVGKFVEFYGEALSLLSTADRATISNMAPEYGATCGVFPIDNETIQYLKLTGRKDEELELITGYYKEQGMFYSESTDTSKILYDENASLDLSSIQPSISGPSRPQDRINLCDSKKIVSDIISSKAEKLNKTQGKKQFIKDGDIALAAITSCTNTSNPGLMLSAGIVAKKAIALGLKVKPWVKTSFGPGSKAVTEYLKNTNLLPFLNQLGFNVVGYGCTTCIGNSGPLIKEVAQEITNNGLTVASVLSGNRNFEGRVHQQIKMNFLASPPLVVIYALAGTANIDLLNEPVGLDSNDNEIFLKDLWPSKKEVDEEVAKITSKDFIESYKGFLDGDKHWKDIKSSDATCYDWDKNSTYIRKPTFFQIQKPQPVNNAHVLALLGDSVTTDHISPAGSISPDSPAARYLAENNIKQEYFNSYGSRRGNHEVMMRGTFANIRLKNNLVKKEGGNTLHIPSNKEMSIYDAAMMYDKENISTIIIAGKEYGNGSSRDWAAKGTNLLKVKAVIAESYERIHRSNLIGMGVLPLSFKNGESYKTLGITGKETFTIDFSLGNKEAKVTCKKNNTSFVFTTSVCIYTPKEKEFIKNGGILPTIIEKITSDEK